VKNKTRILTYATGHAHYGSLKTGGKQIINLLLSLSNNLFNYFGKGINFKPENKTFPKNSKSL